MFSSWSFIPDLYNRGLIYFDICISNDDYIVVPPLQGFVMNRVQGDYFETLLYKIFVSIDEHTTMGDLASVLQVDINQVKVQQVHQYFYVVVLILNLIQTCIQNATTSKPSSILAGLL